jgi:PAS domain S-box-containing protein
MLLRRIKLNLSSKIFFIIILSFISSGLKSIPSSPFDPASEIPLAFSSGLINIMITALAALVIICVLVFIFSLKLKKVNQELIVRNKQIESMNQALIGTNQELSKQNDIVTREFLETDKFFKILFQSAEDGIAFFDQNWNLKFANHAYFSLIGYDQDSYTESEPYIYIHPDDAAYPSERLEALKEKGFHESELRLQHKNGNYVTLSSRSVTVKDESGRIIGALTISRDITRMKEVHQEFVKAKTEAEISNRLKSNFLANISHEIRTPLNSVVGFANLLLSDDLSSETREEYVEHINHNSERLIQILGDIIDLSRLESSQIGLAYEEASVSSIVNDVIREARKAVKRSEKPVVLNFKEQNSGSNDLVFTDKVWLRRVLNHLMDNAIKFTLDGSIEFSYKKENDNLLFCVKDTGIGINKENLARIFEEFRQEIGDHHRPFEGLGIGLTLVKLVVERMGGHVYVKSEKGIGSEFSFTIPYRPVANASTQVKFIDIQDQQMNAINNWSSRKCLLVDDNMDVLVYLKRILADTGINVLKATSGPEALEIVNSDDKIDLVLLDIQLPGMNGIETTKHIRKIRKDLPIIAQTAFIFEEDKDSIIEAGCDACLIKPIRKEHLLTVMSSFIKPE